MDCKEQKESGNRPLILLGVSVVILAALVVMSLKTGLLGGQFNGSQIAMVIATHDVF